jgi:hypothetical protein
MPELEERWQSVPAVYLQHSTTHRDWVMLFGYTRPREKLAGALAVDVKRAVALALVVVVALMPDVVLAVVALGQAELLVDVAQTEPSVAAVVAQVAMVEAVVVAQVGMVGAVVVA